jgi:HAD superfamily hydrolase (TIGR01509 family)
MSLLAIFDHDGVLVDSYDLHLESWLELGRREGLPITPGLIRETFGMTNPSILRRACGAGLDDAAIARFGAAKEACYRDLARGRLALMAGVHELLDALTAAGVALAIGSSGPRENLLLTVRECDLEGRFAAIASLEDVARGKPDPEVFLVAAERVGIVPRRAVVFEDAPVGIRAAKAAGMLAVGVGTTNPLDALVAAGADEVVPDLAGYPVPELLARLAGA